MHTRKPSDIATPSEDRMSRETERLWALKKEQAKQDRASGTESGAEWASEAQTFDEVWAVAALDGPNHNFKSLSALLIDHFGYDGDDLLSLLPEHSGRPLMNREVIKGFVEGAEQFKHVMLIDGICTDEGDEFLKALEEDREKEEEEEGQEEE